MGVTPGPYSCVLQILEGRLTKPSLLTDLLDSYGETGTSCPGDSRYFQILPGTTTVCCRYLAVTSVHKFRNLELGGLCSCGDILESSRLAKACNCFLGPGECSVQFCHAEVEYLGYSLLWRRIDSSVTLVRGGQSSVRMDSQRPTAYIKKRQTQRGTPSSVKKMKRKDIGPSLRIVKQSIVACKTVTRQRSRSKKNYNHMTTGARYTASLHIQRNKS
jgi:hypothetical protein